MSNSDAIDRRLTALERENRRLKWLIFGGVLAAVGAGLGAQVPATTTVQAERFVLVDQQDRTRALLETTAPIVGARTPQLTLFDAAGRTRVRLGLGPRGPVLEVADEAGKIRDFFGPPTAYPLTQR
jgi:hypothetical protein